MNDPEKFVTGMNSTWIVPGTPGKPVLAARFVSWILRKVIEARTNFVSGLEVTVLSESNRRIFMGKVSAVEMKFDRIAFGSLLITGGGKIMIEGLDLRMRRFLFGNLQSQRRPYQIYGDFRLTQSDIVNSTIIRNLLQMLVDLIFKLKIVYNILAPFAQIDENGLQAKVKRVSIRSRRLFVNGDAALPSGRLPFEISTGAGLRDEGHTVFLKDIEVVLNPDTALRTSIVIPLSNVVDVDIGEECSLDNLVIANKHVWLRARSSISPVVPFAVTSSSGQSNTMFKYNIGALLSSMLRVRGVLSFDNKLLSFFGKIIQFLKKLFTFQI